MKHRRSYISILLIISAMIIIILDSKTAFAGSTEGLELCIRTIIPSLLPFFVLSTLLTEKLSGNTNELLSPIGKLCSIPRGQEVLLLIGWLGGYPVGAQNIYQAFSAGSLSETTAKRMLGFCSNAGPSFIFGIAAAFFTEKHIPWVLWGIHIVSSLMVGILLPKVTEDNVGVFRKQSSSAQQILNRSLNALATVCGWIILLRVLVKFLQRWLLWMLPDTLAVAVTGILELANGCCELNRIVEEPIRFLVCSAILNFGGICVWMQTKSVTKELGTGSYIPGKLLQTLLSVLLSLFLLPWIFPGNISYTLSLAALSGILVIGVILLYCRKKEVAFSDKSVYNGLKKC